MQGRRVSPHYPSDCHKVAWTRQLWPCGGGNSDRRSWWPGHRDWMQAVVSQPIERSKKDEGCQWLVFSPFPRSSTPNPPRLSEDEGINDGFVDTIAFLTVPPMASYLHCEDFSRFSQFVSWLLGSDSQLAPQCTPLHILSEISFFVLKRLRVLSVTCYLYSSLDLKTLLIRFDESLCL